MGRDEWFTTGLTNTLLYQYTKQGAKTSLNQNEGCIQLQILISVTDFFL